MADLGTDFLGILDIDADFSVGDGPLALTHAIGRRLTTTPGQMLDDPRYGYNLTLLVNSAIDPTRVSAKTREQCLEEERVAEAHVALTQDLTAQTLTVEIGLELDDGATYALTLNVTQLTAELLLAA